MPDFNSKEKVPSKMPSSFEKTTDPQEQKEVVEKSQELVEGIEGVIESTEVSEGIEGQVGETTGEGKKKLSGGTGAKISANVEQTRGRNEPPPLEVMVIQVRTQLKKDLATLNAEANKYTKGSSFDPYNLSLILAKIRRLREILAEIMNASAEKVKMWWNEYVKKDHVQKK
jgi:hypothetical protein